MEKLALYKIYTTSKKKRRKFCRKYFYLNFWLMSVNISSFSMWQNETPEKRQFNPSGFPRSARKNHFILNVTSSSLHFWRGFVLKRIFGFDDVVIFADFIAQFPAFGEGKSDRNSNRKWLWAFRREGGGILIKWHFESLRIVAVLMAITAITPSPILHTRHTQISLRSARDDKNEFNWFN